MIMGGRGVVGAAIGGTELTHDGRRHRRRRFNTSSLHQLWRRVKFGVDIGGVAIKIMQACHPSKYREFSHESGVFGPF